VIVIVVHVIAVIITISIIMGVAFVLLWPPLSSISRALSSDPHGRLAVAFHSIAVARASRNHCPSSS